MGNIDTVINRMMEMFSDDSPAYHATLGTVFFVLGFNLLAFPVSSGFLGAGNEGIEMVAYYSMCFLMLFGSIASLSHFIIMYKFEEYIVELSIYTHFVALMSFALFGVFSLTVGGGYGLALLLLALIAMVSATLKSYGNTDRVSEDTSVLQGND